MTTQTKTAHTPGPWSYQTDGIVGFYEVSSDKHGHLAETIHDEADARLIAAAPAMLEALKLAGNVLFLLSDEVKSLGHHAENVTAKVKAAIEKAGGR